MSPEESRVAWEAVLTALEGDLTSATGAARVEPTGPEPTAPTGAAWVEPTGSEPTDATGAAWVEPSGLGPVPRELVGRASRLVAAQRDRAAALEEERRVTLEHLGALRAVDATREPRASVYLDASA